MILFNQRIVSIFSIPDILMIKDFSGIQNQLFEYDTSTFLFDISIVNTHPEGITIPRGMNGNPNIVFEVCFLVLDLYTVENTSQLLQCKSVA